jgi:hypothetical protein
MQKHNADDDDNDGDGTDDGTNDGTDTNFVFETQPYNPNNMVLLALAKVWFKRTSV